MKFCHQCGNRLTLGIEKYCPECGTVLNTRTHGFSTGGTNISGTAGDVIGSAISGTGNIIGKEVAYSVHGNVIHLHVESVSAETLQQREQY